MALTVESGFPGCRAFATASLSRSTAALRVAETSVIEREISVAVSMARSAMPGWERGISLGLSMFTCRCFPGCGPKIRRLAGMQDNEAVTFGYPRVRSC